MVGEIDPRCKAGTADKILKEACRGDVELTWEMEMILRA
jgi:hypothetical protein